MSQMSKFQQFRSWTIDNRRGLGRVLIVDRLTVCLTPQHLSEGMQEGPVHAVATARSGQLEVGRRGDINT
jgi:hypothetical protein